MFLKLMRRAAGEFRVIEVTDCSFHRLPEPTALCEQGTPKEFSVALHADAFLLNKDGKTIDIFRINQTDRKSA